MPKGVKIVISLISFILLLIIVAGFFLIKSSVSYEGSIETELNSDITIERGRGGVPMVIAGSIDDAYYAIGFLHAQDGLPLMEYFRAIANARISEIIGEKGVLIDKLSFTVGFSRRADELFKNLNRSYRSYLNSYIKGINRSKGRLGHLKRFFFLSDDEWTGIDVISILLLFEWTDSFLNNRELIFPMPTGITSPQLQNLFPSTLAYNYPKKHEGNILILKKIKFILDDFLGPFLQGFAIYANGKKTIDSRPVMGFLINEKMHVYPKWYPLSIEIDDNKIDGITCLGLPFIFFGNNNNLSFCVYNLQVDTQEFRIEKIKKMNGIPRYFRKGSWKKFKTLSRDIKIGKGGKISEHQISIDIRMTDKGPVISDMFKDDYETDPISIRSIFPGKNYISSLFEIPLSNNPWEARQHLKNVHSMPKIHLFSFPKKAMRVYSGLLPLRYNIKKLFKRDTHRDYKILDLSKYIHLIKNENIIIGSNIFKKAPRLIREYAIIDNKKIYNRLTELINKDKFIEIQDIERLLCDTHSGLAKGYVSLFISLLREIPLPSAKLSRIYFDDWSFFMGDQSVPGTIFQTLLAVMLKETIGDELEGSLDMVMENYHLIVDNFYELLIRNRSYLFDDISTTEKIEDRDMIFDRALLKTMRFLNEEMGPIMNDWQWGRLHNGHYILPLMKKGSLLVRILNNFEDIRVNGGNFTICKGSINVKDGLRAEEVSCLAGIFSEGLSSISLSYGIAQNPRSEYYKNINPLGNFIKYTEKDDGYIMKLIPKE
ncbi:MAG: penicillin acylase family protein [Spirochaetota bacterium]|nr:penicillin acylase family protein [Spirochaetota bacterium]